MALVFLDAIRCLLASGLLDRQAFFAQPFGLSFCPSGNPLAKSPVIFNDAPIGSDAFLASLAILFRCFGNDPQKDARGQGTRRVGSGETPEPVPQLADRHESAFGDTAHQPVHFSRIGNENVLQASPALTGVGRHDLPMIRVDVLQLVPPCRPWFQLPRVRSHHRVSALTNCR